jgi:hypothetical protein
MGATVVKYTFLRDLMQSKKLPETILVKGEIFVVLYYTRSRLIYRLNSYN